LFAPAAAGWLRRSLTGPAARAVHAASALLLVFPVIVRIEPAGNRRIYHLDPAGLAAVRAYFDQFWTTALASFKAAVDQSQEEQE